MYFYVSFQGGKHLVVLGLFTNQYNGSGSFFSVAHMASWPTYSTFVCIFFGKLEGKYTIH